MDRLKHILTLLLLTINTLFVVAQDNSANAETIYMHTNSSTFISGESLYYKLYVINPSSHTSSWISKIAYVAIIDGNHKIIYKSKIDIENGKGQGDYFIPTTIATGNYKLIAYTQWMLNVSLSNFIQTDLLIINPFQSIPEDKGAIKNAVATANVDSETQNRAVFQNENATILSLETNKEIYSTREKVTLKINALSQNIGKGNYSLSLRKRDDLPHQPTLKVSEIVNSNFENSNPSKLLPEVRGELVTGFITSKTPNKDVNNKTIALSIPGKSFAFKVVKTNAEGKFIFILDQEPNSSNAIVQVMEDDRKDYLLQLDESIKLDFSSVKIAPVTTLNPDLKKIIEEHAVANQIENAYYEKKKDSLISQKKEASFFHSIEKEYRLDDYTRFPTLKEVITEIVTEMYYRKIGDTYSIHLRDLDTNAESFGSCLVLVDGLLIQDVNELFNYNMELVDKVDLINHSYVYGPKLFGGVVNFVTKNSDFETKPYGDFIKKVTLERPLPEKKYFNPEYTTTSALERIPDYRYQLLWNPEVNIENQIETITLYTSDISGAFEIVLQGFSEKGTLITITKTIEVK